MKLIDIISAGYKPVGINDLIIRDYSINTVDEVLKLIIHDGSVRYLSCGLDHKNSNIRFVMTVEFDEDIAASMLLSNVAAVERSHIDSIHPIHNILSKMESDDLYRRATILQEMTQATTSNRVSKLSLDL